MFVYLIIRNIQQITFQQEIAQIKTKYTKSNAQVQYLKKHVDVLESENKQLILQLYELNEKYNVLEKNVNKAIDT